VSAHQGAEPGLTVAAVLRVGLPEYARTHRLPPQHWRALRAIQACRTPALGGHLYQCSQCEEPRFVPHSCRNRHCPTCQGAEGYAWLEHQRAALLPVPYFHLVFTLPHGLNPLIQQNQAVCYRLLFAAAAATLLEFGCRQLHAQLGLTLVLHTWGRTLHDHYHVHGIVTGGGLRADGTWAGTPAHWLFPVRALSAMFRGKFRAGLQELFRTGQLGFHGSIQSLARPPAFAALVATVTKTPWVVYAKRPFAGPATVLAYLSRYTHRVGLTNQRLRALDATTRTVSFAYKDYADGARAKSMTLSCDEFIRRLCLHVLPAHFVKLRHYGLLANRNRHACLAQARAALPPATVAPTTASAVPVEPETPPGLPRDCPHCHRQADWILVAIFAPQYHRQARAPPDCTVA
jgi:hypothetical protein